MSKSKKGKRIEQILNTMIKENPGNEKVIEEVKEIIDFCIKNQVEMNLSKINLK